MILSEKSASFRDHALVARIGACAPHIDAGEQEQPDHVDEMPVPSGGLEAEMMLHGERATDSTDQTHSEEDGADDNVEAVEARRHEEGRAVDVMREAEAGMSVFIGLAGREQDAEHHGADQAPNESFAVAFQKAGRG